MRSLMHTGLSGKSKRDAWSRINPESVAQQAYEASPPLTSWQTIWYCLWYPPILWWTSTINPPRGRLGNVSRWFWFGYLGLPPRGLLGHWQFSVYLAIILGIPAAVIAIVEGVSDMELALFLAALFLSWALILYLLYFTGQKEARDAPDLPEGLGGGGSTDDDGHR